MLDVEITVSKAAIRMATIGWPESAPNTSPTSGNSRMGSAASDIR